MTMSGYEKLVLTLPNEAAAKLKELAEQENKTVAAFVANVLDDWLEKRRRDVRLGRTIQQATLLEVGKVTGTGRRR
jgi:predicted DNA-binding protein